MEMAEVYSDIKRCRRINQALKVLLEGAGSTPFGECNDANVRKFFRLILSYPCFRGGWMIIGVPLRFT